MGDYADMAFEQSLYEREYDYENGGDDSLDGCYIRRNPKYHRYTVHSILGETDKGIHVLFAREDTGEPWEYSFWWPKSHTIIYECLDEIIFLVPDWLLRKKFNEGGKKHGGQP